MTVFSTTNFLRITETFTIRAEPASCLTWKGQDRCTPLVRTYHKRPSSFRNRTRCRWSASCTGRKETVSLILPIHTTYMGRPKKALTPKRCRRRMPTRRLNFQKGPLTFQERHLCLHPLTTPGTCIPPTPTLVRVLRERWDEGTTCNCVPGHNVCFHVGSLTAGLRNTLTH